MKVLHSYLIHNKLCKTFLKRDESKLEQMTAPRDNDLLILDNLTTMSTFRIYFKSTTCQVPNKCA